MTTPDGLRELATRVEGASVDDDPTDEQWERMKAAAPKPVGQLTPIRSTPKGEGIVAKLRASTLGLGGEDPHAYMARGVSAGDCLEAADRIEALEEGLRELEAANERLCLMRTDDQYAEQMRLGQSCALLALDEARRKARSLLTQGDSDV